MAATEPRQVLRSLLEGGHRFLYCRRAKPDFLPGALLVGTPRPDNDTACGSKHPCGRSPLPPSDRMAAYAVPYGRRRLRMRQFTRFRSVGLAARLIVGQLRQTGEARSEDN
jgi:hypothetical protein